MNGVNLKNIVIVNLVFLLLTTIAYAQTSSSQSSPPPPIGQSLIREGDLALKLETALGVGNSTDETDAESQLGDLGISPKNGWIADYPVTPDILGEVQQSVNASIDANKLSMSKTDADQKVASVSTEVGLPIQADDNQTSSSPPLDVSSPDENSSNEEAATPAVTPDDVPDATSPQNAPNYSNTTVINNYYTAEGPPVVTYYAPPPSYYYLYTWVPYPFGWYGSWYSGYFILHDFHRPFRYGGRDVFISNHFHDDDDHHVYRIDPIQRYHGVTYGGIGAPRTRNFLNTRVTKSDGSTFNEASNRGTNPMNRGSVSTHNGGREIERPNNQGNSFNNNRRINTSPNPKSNRSFLGNNRVIASSANTRPTPTYHANVNRINTSQPPHMKPFVNNSRPTARPTNRSEPSHKR